MEGNETYYKCHKCGYVFDQPGVAHIDEVKLDLRSLKKKTESIKQVPVCPSCYAILPLKFGRGN